MATTDLITALIVDQVAFDLDYGQEYSGVADGTILAKDLRPALWKAKVTSSVLTLGQLRQARAWLHALKGSIGTFLCWDPAAQYPQADPTGSILGSAAVSLRTINSDLYHVSLKGLPAGYVLTIGDLFSVLHSGTIGLFEVGQTITADGSGNTAEFLVAPGLPLGAIFAVNDQVTLKRPNAEMVIIPGSVTSSVNLQVGSLSFQAIQVISAGVYYPSLDFSDPNNSQYLPLRLGA